MAAKNTSGIFIGVLVVLLACSLYAAFREHQTASTLQHEIQSLNALTNEIARLRIENEEVARLRTANQEIEQLRKDVEDLYRLRNEVRMLREEKAQWQKSSSATVQPQPTPPTQPQVSVPNQTQPPAAQAAGATPTRQKSGRPEYGFYFVNIPPALSTNSVTKEIITGVLVSFVKPGSPAEKAGLQASDMVIRANNKAVSTPAELNDLIKDATIGQVVVLDVIREGNLYQAKLQAEIMQQGQ